jgi:hypothetical protein
MSCERLLKIAASSSECITGFRIERVLICFFFFLSFFFLVSNRESDNAWPEPDKMGKQELEIVLGKEHISFSVRYVFQFLLFLILIFFFVAPPLDSK